MGSQWELIVNFLQYLGVTIPLLLVGLLVFIFTTPYNEFRIIQNGKEAGDPQKVAAAKAVAYDLGES
ncbi:DUF350 domain-containing protein [Paenibacillus sp. CC-CFT747]|nr:DUF350 domain-containing protein [Paenibacillus sp. CC-CFT747]